jgi:hypothetical protein
VTATAAAGWKRKLINGGASPLPGPRRWRLRSPRRFFTESANCGGIFRQAARRPGPDDELRSYQDMLADENARSGMNLADARRKAAVETGGIEQIKNRFGRFGWGFQSTRFRGTRFAIRMLFKQPIFSLTVLSLLAIGIAGTTTIFSVFNSSHLQPLPLKNRSGWQAFPLKRLT